jgi:hypothetical protein
MAQAGFEVDPDDRLVEGVGGGTPTRLDDVLEPVVEVSSESPGLGGNRDASDRLGLCFNKPIAGLLPRPAIDVHRLHSAYGGPGVEGAEVPAVFAWTGDRAFAVVAAAP